MTLIDDGRIVPRGKLAELAAEKLSQQAKIDEWNAAHGFAPAEATPAQMSPYGVSRKRRRAIKKGQECRPKKRQPEVCLWAAVQHRCTLGK